MSLAEETRAAVRERPALFDALRAGVLNYAAAARHLGVSDDTDAVATALRRFEADLDDTESEREAVRVRMNRVAESGDPPIRVGDGGFEPGEGDYTAVFADGDVDARTLERALGILRTHGIEVVAAGFVGAKLSVVVERRDGAEAIRLIEDAH